VFCRLPGDWFSSSAVSSGVERVLTEAVFPRNTTVIWQQMKEFENQPGELLAARKWDEDTSRDRAICYLQRYLDGL
jgi:hypothetical protein